MAPQTGWHPQEIIAEVRKKGTNLQELARGHGLRRNALNRAVRECFPRLHTVIAECIGVPRQDIWPQFYTHTGERRCFKQVRAARVLASIEARAA